MIVWLLILAGLPVLAGEPGSAVEAAERGFAEAVLKADIPGLEKFLAADLVYTHSGGSRDTRASFIEKIRSGSMKYEKLDYQQMEAHRIDQNTAFLTARIDVRLASAARPVEMKVSVLRVWVKRQGRWQLLAHQSARLP